ncbi:hypothetical protein [Streptomyces antimycoticus]|uniref:hypothetical protein n=1 Tax=Streptomyces antimycoticus TaxID=68175 RepID=UPI00386ED071|nr:hypothetical protein OG751_15665 [Streptomyces antimycoticus]
MRAVQVVGYGQHPRMADVPEPEVTGPYDVIVKIGGAGVCRTDLHILEGQWADKSGVSLLGAGRMRGRSFSSPDRRPRNTAVPGTPPTLQHRRSMPTGRPA